MHLFIHQDELDIDYHRFCRIHIETILRFLNYDPQKIRDILDRTDENVGQMDPEAFLRFCEKNIPWFSL